MGLSVDQTIIGLVYCKSSPEPMASPDTTATTATKGHGRGLHAHAARQIRVSDDGPLGGQKNPAAPPLMNGK